uniref:Uncharacterized protein n=1 Tax=Arundo donax TaxID=35708 RepID=A0A0A8Y2N4_ARUDO
MNLEKVAKPNIALLRECGLSVRDIVKMALSSRLLTFNPERVKGFVRRADELGVPRGSAAFKCTVGIASCISEEKVAAKLEVVRNTLGCSTERLCSEVCKRPQILALSEEQLCRKIEFLVTEVGLQPEYILKRLVLLTFSLEKRLMPRHCVLKVLEAKGLMKEGLGFCPIILYGEDDFVARYIDCHKGTVPGLADAYAAARAGEITPKVNL